MPYITYKEFRTSIKAMKKFVKEEIAKLKKKPKKSKTKKYKKKVLALIKD